MENSPAYSSSTNKNENIHFVNIISDEEEMNYEELQSLTAKVNIIHSPASAGHTTGNCSVAILLSYLVCWSVCLWVKFEEKSSAIANKQGHYCKVHK